MICPACKNTVSDNSKVCNFCNYIFDHDVDNCIEVKINNPREIPKPKMNTISSIIASLLLITGLFTPIIIIIFLNNYIYFIISSILSFAISLFGGYICCKADELTKKQIAVRRNIIFILSIFLFTISISLYLYPLTPDLLILEKISIGMFTSSVILFFLGTEYHILSD